MGIQEDESSGGSNMKVYGYNVRYIDEGELQTDYYGDLNGMKQMCVDYVVIDISPDYEGPLIYEFSK